MKKTVHRCDRKTEETTLETLFATACIILVALAIVGRVDVRLGVDSRAIGETAPVSSR